MSESEYDEILDCHGPGAFDAMGKKKAREQRRKAAGKAREQSGDEYEDIEESELAKSRSRIVSSITSRSSTPHILGSESEEG